MPGTPRRVALIRHGETEWSRSGQHTGRTDIPLTATGVEQARAIAAALQGHAFAAVLVSPLVRALETCRLAGLGEQAEVDDDAMEWDYGEYDGLTSAQITERRPGWSLWRDGCPGGESAAGVGRRADRLLARLEGVDGDAAIVAHGHILRVVGARWAGLDPEGGRLLLLATGSVSILGWERDSRALSLWNSTMHLGAPLLG